MVGPADVAALAVRITTNIALTGVTYDIEGGDSGTPRLARSNRYEQYRPQ